MLTESTRFAALVLTVDLWSGRIMWVSIHSATANTMGEGTYSFTPMGWTRTAPTYTEARDELARHMGKMAHVWAKPGTPLHSAMVSASRGESGEVKSC